MPKYFFHIMDGTAFIDTEGVELPDVAAVRSMATATAGQMLAQIGDKFWDGRPWRLYAADEDGAVVVSVVFQSEH